MPTTTDNFMKCHALAVNYIALNLRCQKVTSTIDNIDKLCKLD